MATTPIPQPDPIDPPDDTPPMDMPKNPVDKPNV